MRLQTIALVLVGLLILANGTLFTVYEAERVLISRFGKFHIDPETKRAQVLKPGLHFKLPFIDKLHYFDVRLHMKDIQSSQIMTSEKKHVQVNLFVKWRIEDFELFFNRTSGGLESRAENLLEQKVIDGLRAEFGRRTIRNVVSGERLEIMDRLRKKMDTNAANLGITVMDVRIKRIDLPDQVRNAVYKRMQTERHKEASKLRAEGSKEANIIRADAERQRRVTLASAVSQAEQIRGEGDAKAVKIYANTYNQSPDFYEFYRSLEAYRAAFQSKRDMLVMKPDGQFFKYFHGAKK